MVTRIHARHILRRTRGCLFPLVALPVGHVPCGWFVVPSPCAVSVARLHARQWDHTARFGGVQVGGRCCVLARLCFFFAGLIPPPTHTHTQNTCVAEPKDNEALSVSLFLPPCPPQATRSARGSLLWLLSHCKTPFGSRLLAQWLRRPLINRTAIEARLDAVAELSGLSVASSGGNARPAQPGPPYCLLELLEFLPSLPDLERGCARLCLSVPVCLCLFVCVCVMCADACMPPA